MGRIKQLDGLRALAIAAVFIHHAFHVPLLWMGVDLFFILSGFLITGILARQRTVSLGDYFKTFYAKRARRILPPYAVLLIVVTILYGASWLKHASMYLFLMNFFFPLGIPMPASLDILWSLAVEEQFYMVWPFAVFFLSEKWLFRLSIFLMVLAPVLRWACTPLFEHHWAIYMLTPFRMDLLATGAVLSILWKNRPEAIRRYGSYGLLATVAAPPVFWAMSHFLGYTTYGNQRGANVLIYETSLFACTGVMLWALSGRAVGLLTLRPVVYIGTISYTIYLIHMTMIARLPVLWAVAGTLGYASLSWFLLEKPILHRGHSSAPLPHASA